MQKIKSIEDKTSFVKAENVWPQYSLLNPAEIAVILRTTDDYQRSSCFRLLNVTSKIEIAYEFFAIYLEISI